MRGNKRYIYTTRNGRHSEECAEHLPRVCVCRRFMSPYSKLLAIIIVSPVNIRFATTTSNTFVGGHYLCHPNTLCIQILKRAARYPPLYFRILLDEIPARTETRNFPHIFLLRRVARACPAGYSGRGSSSWRSDNTTRTFSQLSWLGSNRWGRLVAHQ